VSNPLFWLVLSLLFVTVSLTIVLVVAIPTLRELSRAARSAEKLFDTLRREFPPTLQAIRLTGLEISDLTDDVSEGVQSAGQVVKQVDQSLTGVRQQAQRVQSTTRSVVIGFKAAWRAFTRSPKPSSQRRAVDRASTPRPDDFDGASRDDGRSSDLLPDSTRSKARRLSSEADANPSLSVRKPAPALRDPNQANPNEQWQSAASPSNVEQARSSSFRPSESSPDEPPVHQPEPKSLNVRSEADSDDE
jgi:uncharacterized protein YoxC